MIFFEVIFIKRLISLVLAFILVFAFSVSSFATSDSVADGLRDGWGAYYNDLNAISVPSQFTNSWFARLLYAVQHIYTYIHDSPTLNGLDKFFLDNISSIEDADTNLWYLQSAIYYLGHELQNFEYYTPYSGGETTDFATAVNKNLLYLSTQLQALLNNSGSGSVSSNGLMSGWTLSGVPAPDGYNTSWYYRMLQNSGSLATYFNRLFTGTWADFDNFGDGYFYKDYQNSVSTLDSINEFKVPYLTNSYNTLAMVNGQFTPIRADYATSVAGLLYALTFRYGYRYSSPSYTNYLTGNSVRFNDVFWGGSLSQQVADQSSMLSRLAYIFSNDDDIAIKKDSEANSQAVNDNFLSSSGANSVKTDDIGNLSSLSTSVKDTFSTGASSTGVFDILNSNSPWEWFSADVANSLLADSGSSASTFSLRSAPVDNVEVVTSYYEDNLNDFYSWLDLVGDTE